MSTHIPHQRSQGTSSFAQANSGRMLTRSTALSTVEHDVEKQLNQWMHQGAPEEQRMKARTAILNAQEKKLPNLNLENLQLRKLPDCFGKALAHLESIQLHGNSLDSLPASLLELMTHNQNLHLDGLETNPNIAGVGQSMMSKLMDVSQNSKKQMAKKAIELVMPSYAEQNLIKALEKNSALIKNEQFKLMQLGTLNEMALLANRLNTLNNQLKQIQHNPLHSSMSSNLHEQIAKTQERFDVLLDLQKELNQALETAEDANNIEPEQFDALRIQYLVTSKFFRTVLDPSELEAIKNFHLYNPQGVLFIGSDMDIYTQTQFLLNDNTVPWIQSFLRHHQQGLTVDRLFARALCTLIPKQPTDTLKQQAKGMLEATWNKLEKIQLGEIKQKQKQKHHHKKSEKHEKIHDYSSSDSDDESGENSWKEQISNTVMENMSIDPNELQQTLGSSDTFQSLSNNFPNLSSSSSSSSSGQKQKDDAWAKELAEAAGKALAEAFSGLGAVLAAIAD